MGLGRAKGIKVATEFDGYKVERWLAAHPAVEVLDIKFAFTGNDPVDGLPVYLIIYRETA